MAIVTASYRTRAVLRLHVIQALKAKGKLYSLSCFQEPEEGVDYCRLRA